MIKMTEEYGKFMTPALEEGLVGLSKNLGMTDQLTSAFQGQIDTSTQLRKAFQQLFLL